MGFRTFFDAVTEFAGNASIGKLTTNAFVKGSDMGYKLDALIESPEIILNSAWAKQNLMIDKFSTEVLDYLQPLRGARPGIIAGAGLGALYGGYRSRRNNSSFLGTLSNIGFFGTVGAAGGGAIGYSIPAVKAVSRIMKENAASTLRSV